jgi:6-phosphogluconate dehydrogenase
MLWVFRVYSLFIKTNALSLLQNLAQAQHDYFGAYTYERTDKPSGEFFHTEWMK